MSETPGPSAPLRASANQRFALEFRDFWQFVRAPRLGPRLPGRRGHLLRAELFDGTQWSVLLRWAAVLWGINLVFLGPLAALVASGAGAQRQFDWSFIPWFHVLIWAPFIEEMLFRLGLRALRLWLILLPMLMLGFLYAQSPLVIILTVTVVVMVVWGVRHRPLPPLPWAVRRAWQQNFGTLFYASTVLFAALHWLNFDLQGVPLWAWPLLVLPQFASGLVMGWLRVRHGMGSAILLHALFNAGPLLVLALWLGAGLPVEAL